MRMTCVSEGVAARVGRVRQGAHLSHHTHAAMSVGGNARIRAQRQLILTVATSPSWGHRSAFVQIYRCTTAVVAPSAALCNHPLSRR